MTTRVAKKMADVDVDVDKELELAGVYEIKEDSKPKIIGYGSYAEVWELEFHGLKCAGKQFHENMCNDEAQTRRNIFRECQLLANLRHPYIVQFLGVHKSKYSSLPVLVMEYLHTTLNECIKKWYTLPEAIAYTILEDVALALCYLHSKNVGHRDLSSSNVLLTMDMHAKISDLGMAKILNITPKQKRKLTAAPGTLCYMPPEAIGDNPTYMVEIDIFSYGVLAMEVFCGEIPIPTNEFEEDSTSTSDSRFRRLTEIARRRRYLDKISPQHPIIDLIEQCLEEPGKRPNAQDAKAYIRRLKANVTVPCDSKLQLLQERRDHKKTINNQKKEIQQLKNEKSDSQFNISELERKIRLHKLEPLVDELKEELTSTKNKLQKAEKEVKIKTSELLDQGQTRHGRIHLLERQRNEATRALLSGEQVSKRYI